MQANGQLHRVRIATADGEPARRTPHLNGMIGSEREPGELPRQTFLGFDFCHSAARPQVAADEIIHPDGPAQHETEHSQHCDYEDVRRSHALTLTKDLPTRNPPCPLLIIILFLILILGRTD